MNVTLLTRKIFYKIGSNMSIISLFIVAAILRISRINSIGYTDELVFFWAVRDGGIFNYFIPIYYEPIYQGIFIWTHPIMSPIFYWISGFLFGFSTVSMRLVPFLFGMLNIFLVYKLTKKFR